MNGQEHSGRKWAADELRSTNAQIESLLRRALAEEGRLPSRAGEMHRSGRPPRGSMYPPIWTVLKSGLLAALSAHNWMI